MLWPRSSQFLCHHCCHPFTTVPVYIPIWDRDHYRLVGNYCSWNCAKSDAINRNRTRRYPVALSFIALFAYQISYRGRNCRFRSTKHPAHCNCHSGYAGLCPAPPKENLVSFGGNQSLDSFRRGFLLIERYEWIERYFDIYKPCIMKNIKDKRGMIQIESDDMDIIELIRQRNT